jgi:hypothetical protein
LDLSGIQPAALNQPRDQRVRVPHLARIKFVATPNRRGHVGYQIEYALRLTWIVGQSLRTCDRLSDIGDDAVARAAYLVPEDSEEPRQGASDRAVRNNAPPGSVVVSYWCHLDHEAP